MSNKRIVSRNGQAILEVVLAMAIVVMVLLALIIIGTISLKNSSFSRNQALATKYAQSAMELVRVYRDQNNWQTFAGNCGIILTPFMATLPPAFTLNVNCLNTDAVTTEVGITITWTESDGNHSSELKTTFTNWR